MQRKKSLEKHWTISENRFKDYGILETSGKNLEKRGRPVTACRKNWDKLDEEVKILFF